MTVFERVCGVLADSLGMESDAIQPNSQLVADLGAESIDLLDILFRLESEFGLILEREDLFPDFLYNPHSAYLVCGDLTDSGRREILKYFPFLSKAEVKGATDPQALLTVRLLAGTIEQRLPRRPRRPNWAGTVR